MVDPVGGHQKVIDQGGAGECITHIIAGHGEGRYAVSGGQRSVGENVGIKRLLM